MRTLSRWWHQWLCGRAGHMEVTRRHGQRLQIECFICDKAIGRGMDFTGLQGPRHRLAAPLRMVKKRKAS